MSIDEASTGLGSAAPRRVTPYSVSIPHTFGMATASAYLRLGPTLLHETVGTIRRCRSFAARAVPGSQPGQPAQGRPGRASSSPWCFAVVVVTGNDAAALFASFGALSPRSCSPTSAVRCPRRFRAYVAAGGDRGGCSWPSAPRSPTRSTRPSVATGVVAFLIAFSGALGGYFAAGGTRGDARHRPGGHDARGRSRSRRPRARLDRQGCSSRVSPRWCSGRCTSETECARTRPQVLREAARRADRTPATERDLDRAPRRRRRARPLAPESSTARPGASPASARWSRS